MSRYIIFVITALVLLSACTVDENGIRDPVSEARAAATRTGAETTRKNAEVDLAIREQVALSEVKAKEAELKLRQAQAEADAYRARVMADAEADAAKVRLSEQARVGAQVTAAFGFALSGVLILAALAVVVWMVGYSYSRARVAVLSSNYVRIGVEPSTLLPPPLVITADGYLIDTRSGERSRLRDGASVDRLRLVATTHSTDLAIVAQSAERIARQKHPAASQVADQLPTIAASLPMLDAGGNE